MDPIVPTATVRNTEAQLSRIPTQVSTKHAFEIEVDRKSEEAEGASPTSDLQVDPPPVVLSKARLVFIAAIVSSTMCLGGANAMGIIIALPNIQVDLNMKSTDLQWIASVYALTNGCFLLLAGRLADIHGRKMMFVAGVGWLAIWSLVGGFMQNGVALIITRALAGVGNAMSAPSAIGLIANYYTGKARNYAFAAFAAGAPVGGAMGLILGGVLISYSSHTWRTLFWVLGAMAFALSMSAYFLIPKQPPRGSDTRIDWVGAVLITVSLIFIQFVISDGASAPQGWGTSYIIALLILGVILLVAFVFWEHYCTKHKIVTPLLRLHLFTQAKGKLAAIYFIGFVSWMGFSALLFHATLFYQDVQGNNSVQTMLRFLPTAVSGVLCNVIVAWVVNRVRTQWIICFGVTCTAIANILFAVAPKDGSYWALPFNGMWLSVVGADFLMSTGSIFVAALALPEEQSVAGAVSQTLFRLGGAFGLATTTAIAESYTTRSLLAGVPAVDADLNGIHAACWLGAGFSIAALVIAIVMLRGMGVMSKHKAAPPPSATVEPGKTEEKQSV